MLMFIQATQGGAPSRREAMFGLLGAGLGVGFTTAYFKSEQQEQWHHQHQMVVRAAAAAVQHTHP